MAVHKTKASRDAANKKRREKMQRKRQEEAEAAKVATYLEIATSGKVAVDGTVTVAKRGARARDVIMEAFDALGGVDGLVEFGKKYPKEFYTLWGKMIPRETNVDVGENLEELLGRLSGTGSPPASGDKLTHETSPILIEGRSVDDDEEFSMLDAEFSEVVRH